MGAGVTTTATIKPRVSTNRWRLRLLTLYISVKTNAAVLRGRFDTLTIERTRRGLRLSLLATTLRMTQLLHHTRPQPPATPPPAIAINCIPVVEILGQH